MLVCMLLLCFMYMLVCKFVCRRLLCFMYMLVCKFVCMLLLCFRYMLECKFVCMLGWGAGSFAGRATLSSYKIKL